MPNNPLERLRPTLGVLGPSPNHGIRPDPDPVAGQRRDMPEAGPQGQGNGNLRNAPRPEPRARVSQERRMVPVTRYEDRRFKRERLTSTGVSKNQERCSLEPACDCTSAGGSHRNLFALSIEQR